MKYNTFSIAFFLILLSNPFFLSFHALVSSMNNNNKFSSSSHDLFDNKKIPLDDIYYSHKQIILEKSPSLTYNTYDFLSISKSFIPRTLNFNEYFFILDTYFNDYRNASCSLITETDHAYFFTEDTILSAYGEDYVKNIILTESKIFETNIINKELELFYNISGTLGNIGDGKVIILFASLIEGVAGYFDPFNEYTQEQLNDMGLGNYKSNEWEMIFLDFVNYYNTTIAHELQHLIHFNHDQDEVRWIDEGLSEFVGYITNTQPVTWNNITPFSYYFLNNLDDSLIYWNFYSNDGRDVRIDYGGAYLFVFYIYEQFGKNIITYIVLDTKNAVDSLTSFLDNYNMTFNELYNNFYTAIILDKYDLNNKYSFQNINITEVYIKNLYTNNEIYLSTYYYGYSFFSLNYSHAFFNTNITSLDNTILHIIVINFYYNNTIIISHDSFVSTKSILHNKDSEQIKYQYVGIGYLSENKPTINGDFGLGQKKTVRVKTLNLFDLELKDDYSIILNNSILSISNIYITFINNTNIVQLLSSINVHIDIVNIYTTYKYNLTYNLTKYNGWGNFINITQFKPGSYTLFLNCSSGNYSLYTQLYSFNIEYKIIIKKPSFTYYNSSSFIISTTYYTIPTYYYKQINENIIVTAYIYNSNQQFILSEKLYYANYTWSYIGNIVELEPGTYYTHVYLNFNNIVYISDTSNTITISETSALTSNNSHVFHSLVVISSLSVSISACLLIIFFYYYNRKKVSMK